MTNPVHLLSIAALLLAAFLVGAVVGSVVRLLVLRLTRKPPAIAAAPVAEAPPIANPLVATPVIAPLAPAPTPVAPPPAEVPVPDFAATLLALAEESPPPTILEVLRPTQPAPSAAAAEPAATVAVTEPLSQLRAMPEIRGIPRIAPLPAMGGTEPLAGMQPARVAGEATSGRHIETPAHDSPPEPPASAHSAEVIPFPTAAVETPEEAANAVDPAQVVEAVVVAEPVLPAAEPVVVAADTSVVPTPDVTALQAWAGSEDFIVFTEDGFIGGQMATDVPGDAKPTPQPAPAAVPDTAIETEAVIVAPPAEVLVEDLRPEPVSAAEPVAATEATPAAPIEAPAAPNPQPAPEPAAAPLDEDAAMRAIEGNWTPRRPLPRVPRPALAPEGMNQAVAASARAVASARRTAEAAVAEAAADAGRPPGLEAPRDGRKDDLTHIIGVLPIIETALNALGIYHFDQVGELTDEQIGWIETHLGVPGRIGRELWREQARELAAVLKPRRAAEH